MGLLHSNPAWALFHVPVVPLIVASAARGLFLDWIALSWVVQNLGIAASLYAIHRAPH